MKSIASLSYRCSKQIILFLICHDSLQCTSMSLLKVRQRLININMRIIIVSSVRIIILVIIYITMPIIANIFNITTLINIIMIMIINIFIAVISRVNILRLS